MPPGPPGARLIVTTSVLIVASCLAISVLLGHRNLRQLTRSLADRGQTISEFLAREGELGELTGNVTELQKLAEWALTQRDVVYGCFYDARGAFLASAGRAPEAAPYFIPGDDATDGEPVAVGENIWEFYAPIQTTTRSARREELQFSADDPSPIADGQPTRSQRSVERVGTVVVGISTRSLDEQRRTVLLSAALITLPVALIAVLSTVLLTRRHVQALASVSKLAEERAHVAELKARFVTSASHEFRTPLAIILAASDTLKRYGDRITAEQRLGRLGKIQTAVHHMTELLDGVLSFGRAEAGKEACTREPVDLAALCQEAVGDVQSTALQTHRLVLSTVGLEREVWLDRRLVRQMLCNLLVNAIKYSPDGGTIECTGARHGDAVELRVSDQGIGIPPEDQRHLFEPFHRAGNVGKIPGSGLGLAITRKAVESHGGSITVQSTVGCGTTFLIRLPSGAERREAGAASPIAAQHG